MTAMRGSSAGGRAAGDGGPGEGACQPSLGRCTKRLRHGRTAADALYGWIPCAVPECCYRVLLQLWTARRKRCDTGWFVMGIINTKGP